MLGNYLTEEFREGEVKALGLRDDSDYRCDLTKDSPDFGNERFDLVIHSAGTEENVGAMDLNLEGTKRLLQALEKNRPDNFVFVSSYKVYSRDAGENITEDANTWATDEAGKSKALAEEYLKEWCSERDVTLTIVRPARMFGNGVKGETLQLFNDALSGKYIHVRGNDAKVSIVCALDVAKGIRKIYERGGIYNAADPQPVKYIDMVEAMTANAGALKRMTHLPMAWAEWIWRIGRFIPMIDRHLNPAVVEKRMKTFTINGSKLARVSGIKYFNTIEVMKLDSPDYPYTGQQPSQLKNIHEV